MHEPESHPVDWTRRAYAKGEERYVGIAVVDVGYDRDGGFSRSVMLCVRRVLFQHATNVCRGLRRALLLVDHIDNLHVEGNVGLIVLRIACILCTSALAISSPRKPPRHGCIGVRMYL